MEREKNIDHVFALPRVVSLEKNHQRKHTKKELEGTEKTLRLKFTYFPLPSKELSVSGFARNECLYNLSGF